MRKYHDIVVGHQAEVPTYFVRFEDLIMSPRDTLLGLFSFLLDSADLRGSNLERRLDEVMQLGHSATTTYTLKQTTTKFNAHVDKYTPA